MARTIDQQARRREIVEAVWRLLERDGLDAASVRGVAAETGLSTGSIRHFFASQAELHLFALTTLSERVGERVRRAAEEPDVRRRALAMVAELMPLRDDTTRELSVWWEFVHRSRRDPALHRVVARQATEVRELLDHVTGGLHELGELPPDVDPGELAARLAVVVDGVTFQLLSTPELLTRFEAAALVERVLLDPVGVRPGAGGGRS